MLVMFKKSVQDWITNGPKSCFANGPDFERDLEAQPFEIRAEMSGF